MNFNRRCFGINCFNDEISEKSFPDYCQEFDKYPTIIEHKERIIAIGDIHGDMNLAINFLKTAHLIEEVDIAFILSKNPDSKIKEYIHKIMITNTNKARLYSEESDKSSYGDISSRNINQIELVYRYYEINNEYYVRVVQENNNPNMIKHVSSDSNRWFKWTGGTTYVVQVGDQVDRCRPFDFAGCKSRTGTINDEDSDLEIMLFYDSLDRVAKKSGGRVLSLLGNHEIMNINGDMRYVSYLGLINFSQNNDVNQGSDNRSRAFKSIISRKLGCTRSTVLVIGNFLFVHGGIAHELAVKYRLLDINEIVRKYLHGATDDNLDLQRILESSRFSPLWYRKLAYIPEDVDGEKHTSCRKLEKTINKINEVNSSISTDPVLRIKGMVIGHTPQFTVFGKGITTACGNRIIRADIGSSNAFSYFIPKTDEEMKIAREPQVIEIITNLRTKESIVKILRYSEEVTNV